MSFRNNTCNGHSCPFFRKYREQCPNYIVNVFETVEGHQYEVKDCAPRRSNIMIQELHNVILAGRQDANRAHNANILLVRQLSKVFDIDEPVDVQLIEDTHVKDSS